MAHGCWQHTPHPRKGFCALFPSPVHQDSNKDFTERAKKRMLTVPEETRESGSVFLVREPQSLSERQMVKNKLQLPVQTHPHVLRCE